MSSKDTSQQIRGKLISLSEACAGTPYSQEYLSLRARQGKLQAVKQGRNWFTTKDWIHEYVMKSGWDDKRDVYADSVHVVATVKPFHTFFSTIFLGAQEFFRILPLKTVALVLAVFVLGSMFAFGYLTPERERGFFSAQSGKVLGVKVAEEIPVLTEPVFSRMSTGFERVRIASYEGLKKVNAFVGVVTDSVKGMFVSEYVEVVTVTDYSPEKISYPKSFNDPSYLHSLYENPGIVITSVSSTDRDALKQEIADSFSDPVVVELDDTGTAGIIRPVFEEPGSEEYLYVLVPIEDARATGNSNFDENTYE